MLPRIGLPLFTIGLDDSPLKSPATKAEPMTHSSRGHDQSLTSTRTMEVLPVLPSSVVLWPWKWGFKNFKMVSIHWNGSYLSQSASCNPFRVNKLKTSIKKTCSLQHPAKWFWEVKASNNLWWQRCQFKSSKSLDLGMLLMSSKTMVATFAKLLGITISHFVKMKTCPAFSCILQLSKDSKLRIWHTKL